MRMVRVGLVLLAVLGVLLPAGKSEAVIYKYLSEKGDPVYVDDLAKVPEPVRDKAVVVTGKEEQELTDDAERARAIAARQAAQDEQIAEETNGDTLLKRLTRSGIAIALVVTVLIVLMNVDALKEKMGVVRKVRIALLALLVLFLGFTHAPDVAGLFQTAGDAVPSPLSSIKERQAEKGRTAADAYKNMDQMLRPKVQAEAERLQTQLDDAERGK